MSEKIRELNVPPSSFNALIEGPKTNEIWLDDRDCQEGAELTLREWDPDRGEDAYTGQELRVLILRKKPRKETWVGPEYLHVMIVQKID